MHLRYKRIALCGIVSVVLFLISSLSLFTDRIESKFNVKAGSVWVDLELDEKLLEDEGAKGFAPSDIRNIQYEVINYGSMAVDVRETIYLSAFYDDGVALPLQSISEFELYEAEDIKETEGYGWEAAADPLSERYFNGLNVIKYELPEYSLDPNKGFKNVERVFGTDEMERHLALLFDRYAPNDMQGSTVYVEFVVEAKQHRNTGKSDWVEARHVTLQLIDGKELQVVEGRFGEDIDREEAASLDYANRLISEIYAYFGDKYINWNIDSEPAKLDGFTAYKFMNQANIEIHDRYMWNIAMKNGKPNLLYFVSNKNLLNTDGTLNVTVYELTKGNTENGITEYPTKRGTIQFVTHTCEQMTSSGEYATYTYDKLEPNTFKEF